jgi:virginiamycin B lyase
MERRFASIVLTACVASLACMVLASSASAYIYWADAQNNKIGRAENDGSGVNPSFIQTGQLPFAVAVDSSHIYWANQNGNSIGRANINGSEVNNNFITGITKPTGVAVNSTSIFWATLGGLIGKANINGTGVNPTLVTGLFEPCGVALDSGHVYWGEISTGTPAYIARAGLDGTNQQLTYVTIPGTSFPCGVAVNSANIFWSEPGIFGGGTRIGRANTNTGTGADPSFIGGASEPCGVALFGSQLYWANGESNAIARANTDGTAVNQSFLATGAGETCGVAVDGLASEPAPGWGGPGPGNPAIPKTKILKGPGSALAQGKAKFTFRSSESHSTFLCKLDRAKPSRCKSPKTYKHLKPGRHTFKVWATDPAGNKDPTPAKHRFSVPA